jgi:hypothetical protein
VISDIRRCDGREIFPLCRCSRTVPTMKGGPGRLTSRMARGAGSVPTKRAAEADPVIHAHDSRRHDEHCQKHQDIGRRHEVIAPTGSQQGNDSQDAQRLARHGTCVVASSRVAPSGP